MPLSSPLRPALCPRQLLHPAQHGFPRSLPVEIAKCEHRLGALRRHERRLLDTIFLHEDVGGAVDVEIRDHAEALAALLG
jgi:hypothetical protein